jgi:O-antigen ligase
MVRKRLFEKKCRIGPNEESNPRSVSARFGAWIFLTVVALAPLPFGSFDLTAVAFWCGVLGFALILAPLRELRAQHFILIGLGFAVVLAYLFVVHEQLAAEPWLSVPASASMWLKAGDLLHERLMPSIAIVRNEPYLTLGRPLVAILSLANGFLFCADEKVARRLLRIIAWSGVCYAVFGIAQHVMDPTKILWREKHAYLGVLTSTFVNRNTAAVYFGSCSVIWLSFTLQPVRTWMTRDGVSWRGVFKRFMADIPQDVVIPVLMLLICLTAMFMTGSRAGVILSLVAITLTFNLYFRHFLKGWTGLTMGAVISVAGVLLALQFLGGGVVNRFDFQGAADEDRLATYRATLRMIADNPWLGTGQGTFAWAFPAYRSSDTSMLGTWDIAHNSLLEIASDMGIPIAALVTFCWIVIFGVLIRGIPGSERTLAVRISALAVALLAVCHSMVDFSLQIPGYSIVALALVGAGLSQCCLRRNRKLGSRVRVSGSGIVSRRRLNIMTPNHLAGGGLV